MTFDVIEEIDFKKMTLQARLKVCYAALFGRKLIIKSTNVGLSTDEKTSVITFGGGGE